MQQGVQNPGAGAHRMNQSDCKEAVVKPVCLEHWVVGRVECVTELEDKSFGHR